MRRMGKKNMQQLSRSILASVMENSCIAPSNGISLSMARSSVHGITKTFAMALCTSHIRCYWKLIQIASLATSLYARNRAFLHLGNTRDCSVAGFKSRFASRRRLLYAHPLIIENVLALCNRVILVETLFIDRLVGGGEATAVASH